MFKAEDIAISVHHQDASKDHWCRVEFFFRNGKDASQAYRAVERLYEMNRPQLDALAGAPTPTTQDFVPNFIKQGNDIDGDTGR